MQLIGKKVVVRSSPSGCWHGELVSMEGTTATLRNARRLWRWWAAKGVSISGVASGGLKESKISECRIALPVEIAVILDVCEVLSASLVASDSIESAPVAP